MVTIMWTERERYITSFEEIKAYIEQIGFFHDHRIGNIQHNQHAVHRRVRIAAALEAVVIPFAGKRAGHTRVKRVI